MRTIISARVLMLAAVAGCRPAGLETRVPSALRQVPLQVTIGGQSLYLESYLWRDFMPVISPDGRPLAAVLRVRSTSGRVPPGLEVDSAWVVKGREVWATAPRAEHPAESVGELEVVAREGPRWAPGEVVDVVVRIRAGGTRALLRAAGQRIRRTD